MPRICPDCKTEVQDNELLCPVCQRAVPRDLSKVTDGEDAESSLDVQAREKKEKKGVLLSVLIGLVLLAAAAVFLVPRIREMNQPAYQKIAVEWMESEFDRIIKAGNITVLSIEDSEVVEALESEDGSKILVKAYLSTKNSSSGAEEYDLYYVYLSSSDNQIIKEDSKCVHYGSNENDIRDYAAKNTPEGYHKL